MLVMVFLSRALLSRYAWRRHGVRGQNLVELSIGQKFSLSYQIADRPARLD